MKLNAYSIFAFLIISSYAFGFVCIQLGYWPYLVTFTWFQMLLTASSLLWYHLFEKTGKRRNFLTFFAASAAIGFFVEVLGVNTGKIFGVYSYGEVLGIMWLRTPFMIGVNWFLVSFVVNQVLQRKSWSLWLHTIVAAAVITGLDVLIEPTAIATGMWSWQNDVVPLQNYIAWFGVSLLISALYRMIGPYENEKLSSLILWCMLLFFGLKVMLT